jgi:hypothetical protein
MDSNEQVKNTVMSFEPFHCEYVGEAEGFTVSPKVMLCCLFDCSTFLRHLVCSASAVFVVF